MSFLLREKPAEVTKPADKSAYQQYNDLSDYIRRTQPNIRLKENAVTAQLVYAGWGVLTEHYSLVEVINESSRKTITSFRFDFTDLCSISPDVYWYGYDLSGHPLVNG